jgi:hypothetical protein
MPTAPNSERRKSPRKKPGQLVYVEFGRENGGMVKNVSEGGLRFHLMNPVAAGQELHFGITIDATRRIEGQARMVWTDASGKSGGMAFTEMSAESRATFLGWLADIDAPMQSEEVRPARVPPSAIPPPPVTGGVPQIQAAKGEAAQVEPVSSMTIPVAVSPPPVPMAPAASADVVAALAPASTPAIPPAAMQPMAHLQPIREYEPPSMPVVREPEPAAPMFNNDIPRPVSPVPQTSVATALLTPSLPPMRVQREPIPSPPAANASATRVAELTAEFPRLASHDEWRAAAREGQVEERRPRRAHAGIEEKRAVAPAAGRSDNRKLTELAEQVDPMREFLKHPIGSADRQDAEPIEGLPLDELAPEPRVPGSRIALIFALAAICGVVAAFVTIAYRQQIGEAIIRLGERISGEPRSAVDPNGKSSGQDPAASGLVTGASKFKGTQPSDSSGAATDSRRSGVAARAPAGNSVSVSSTIPHVTQPNASSGVQPTAQPNTQPAAEASTQPGTQPSVRPDQQPSTQVRQPTILQIPEVRQSAPPQAELAAGKEIIPGKPKPLADDVSSLWIAVENGDSAAEVSLANRYASGEGVAKNCDQARILLQAAAKRGSSAAAKRLTELPAAGCQ